MSKNLVLLGPPGSGKGTQAEKLSIKLKIPAISTGDALRNEVKEQTQIGRKAKSFMDSGQLVPDQVVLEIVRNRISQSDCDKGFILDGFPRNKEQGIMLDESLLEIDKRLNLVLNFEISDEEVIKRISGRFFCKNCGQIYNKYFKEPKKKLLDNYFCDECESQEFYQRDDDNEGTVKNRLEIYHEKTAKLIEFYEKKDLIFSFNAVKSSVILTEELIEATNKRVV